MLDSSVGEERRMDRLYRTLLIVEILDAGPNDQIPVYTRLFVLDITTNI